MRKFSLNLLAIGLFIAIGIAPTWAEPDAQRISGLSLSVEAGFDGYFRDLEWMPVQVRLANDGEARSGQLVIRPETSGEAITNAFTTPVTLPTGARQSVFLYITARSFAAQVRVELIDDNGLVLAAESARLRSILPRDRLYAVVTTAPTGAIDLTGTRFSGGDAFQAIWTLDDLPELTAAYDSIDLLLIHDIDTGSLSSGRAAALADWVARGGHLVVAGGPNWQATSAGLLNLLPILPGRAVTVPTLDSLARWVGAPANDADVLNEPTTAAAGALRPGARVLVAADDGQPLLVRWSFGGGTVDYLTVDPGTQPLRGWSRLPDFWFALQATRPPSPGWANDFGNWDQAARAVEIFPGFEPLPSVLPLCGFLVGYILLIGPVNYLVLSRLNRREWAWVTIPLLIILFSGLAWAFGMSLRGSEATVNQLAVIQSWPNQERARADLLVGLLSPRRVAYDLVIEPGAALRPIPRPLETGTLLTRGVQTSIAVEQAEAFAARSFTVDSSFVAGFHINAIVTAPAIGGSATLTDDPVIAGQQRVRGSVRNEGDTVLRDPVILARGVAYRLESALAPGAVVPFELVLPGEGPAAPSPRMPTAPVPTLAFRASLAAAEQSVLDILSTERIDPFGRVRLIGATPEQQAFARRQLFLLSLVDDTYQSPGRGDLIYLAGWLDEMPIALDLEGASWEAQGETLLLAALEVEIVQLARRALIPAERFTWAARDLTGLGEASPVDLNLQPGQEIAFRFTPLADAVLSEVTELRVRLENLNVGRRLIPLYLWNWSAGRWDLFEVTRESYTIADHQPYIGPQNAVEIRLVADEIGGFLRVGRLGVEQAGRFSLPAAVSS